MAPNSFWDTVNDALTRFRTRATDSEIGPRQSKNSVRGGIDGGKLVPGRAIGRISRLGPVAFAVIPIAAE